LLASLSSAFFESQAKCCAKGVDEMASYKVPEIDQESIFDAKFKKICREIITEDIKLLDADAIHIRLLDFQTNELVMTEGILRGGHQHPYVVLDGLGTKRKPVGTDISGKVALTGNPILVCDLRRAPAFQRCEDRFRRLREKNEDFNEYLESIKSELTIPLKVNDVVYGIVTVQSQESNAFSEPKVAQSVLEDCMNRVATELSLEKYGGRKADVKQLIHCEFKLETRLKTQLQHCISILGADTGHVRLFKSQNQELVYLTGQTPLEQFLEQVGGKRRRLSDNIFSQVIQSAKPRVIKDLQTNSHFKNLNAKYKREVSKKPEFKSQEFEEFLFDARSEMVIPLIANGKVIGCGVLKNKDTLLFELRDNLDLVCNALDADCISDALRELFEQHQISLSQNVVVSTKEPRNRWLVTDESRDIAYVVRKHKGRLDILKQAYVFSQRDIEDFQSLMNQVTKEIERISKEIGISIEALIAFRIDFRDVFQTSLNQCLTELRKRLKRDVCCGHVRLLDQSVDELVLVAGEGPYKDSAPRRIKTSEYHGYEEILEPNKMYFRTNRVQYEDYFKRMKRDFIVLQDICDRYQKLSQTVRAEYVVPLKVGGRGIGTASVHSNNQNYFTEVKQKEVERLMEKTALRINDALFPLKIEQLQSKIINMARPEDLNQVLRDLARGAIEILRAEIVTVFRYDANLKELINPPVVDGIRIQPDFAGEVEGGFPPSFMVREKIDEFFFGNLEVLFSVGLYHQTDLAHRKVSEDLRKVFSDNGVLLSQNIEVSIEKQRWLITDRDKMEEYGVSRGESRLDVCFEADLEHPKHKDLRQMMQAENSFSKRERIVSVAGLEAKGKILGAIFFHFRHPQEFSESRKSLMRTFASQAAIAIQGARRFEAAVRARRQQALIQTSGMIAHRLRNVLPVISHRIGKTLEKGWVSGNGIELCKVALDRTRRAQRIVADFETFARSEGFVCSDLLSAASLVAELEKVVKESLSTDDIRVQASITPDLPRVKVNLERLNDDFANFARDSKSHFASDLESQKTKPLCITVSCELANQIDIQRARLRDRGTYLKLIYTDNGSGIPHKFKPHVFDPFFTTTAGSGLGLAITKYNAEVHGGTVIECGKPTEGVRFELYLPTLPD
jgi:signal transduction histidine kinase/putative methionine-R-sulfoxide reductase with GAF domain